MEDPISPVPNRDREGAVDKLTLEDARLIEAVKRGEDALERGEFLTHEHVGKRLERFLQS
jgi:predicted transcriptional regulator